VITHVLGDDVFYFENPNVRDRLGENIPCSGILADGTLVACKGANPDGRVTVTARVNFAIDFSSKFVGRDRPQAATRMVTDCANSIPIGLDDLHRLRPGSGRPQQGDAQKMRVIWTSPGQP